MQITRNGTLDAFGEMHTSGPKGLDRAPEARRQWPMILMSAWFGAEGSGLIGVGAGVGV
jgi:hypothetical protein